eukprot:TRINITY_DN9029_c0_g1_i3.p1 TRINITY_DN9029_c0_g1~~TRINITY_DN9029_c0_g1_i3.p1  ORF type:complete len:328 (+),score=76.52 TRINITY_DN9029_c0_g1_i3:310-1293(+)
MTHVNEVLLEGFPVTTRLEYLTYAEEGKADLVIASYSLSELSDDTSRVSILRVLWNNVAKGGVLCIVEPGTPVGFKIVRNARSLILDLGSTSGNKKLPPKIVAPCTHHFQCPMGTNRPDWCHFIQRVQRTPSQISMKEKATLNYENEKFSYIMISKGPIKGKDKINNTDTAKLDELEVGEQWARIIRQPLKRGGHVVLDSCTGTGKLSRKIITRSHGDILYKSARKSSWGDVYNIPMFDESAEIKRLKPKRPWKEIYGARKLKKKEKNAQKPVVPQSPQPQGTPFTSGVTPTRRIKRRISKKSWERERKKQGFLGLPEESRRKNKIK